MSDYDPSFRSLAPNVRSRIDNAFYSALPKIGVPDRGSTYDAPGGFLLDDDHSMAGGFLPPSPPAVVQQGGHESGESEEPSHIPLSRIPYALQLLDLPPDDEDVLAVFRNAATGWGDDHHSSRRTRHHYAMVTGEENEVVEEHVSLKDWRAVCAALMDDGGYVEGAKEGDAIDEEEEESADADATGQDLSSGLEESSGESSDEYRSEARSQKRPRKSSARPGVTQKTRPRKTRRPSHDDALHCLRAQARRSPRDSDVSACKRSYSSSLPCPRR